MSAAFIKTFSIVIKLLKTIYTYFISKANCFLLYVKPLYTLTISRKWKLIPIQKESWHAQLICGVLM
jgi:hypothetical protein